MSKKLRFSLRIAILSAGMHCLFAIGLAQQPAVPPPAPNTVTGHITNEKGEPMEGVTVTEKNTRNSLQTDSHGDFRIKEMSVASGQAMKISPSVKASDLDDIVVVRYATQKRRDLTASVSSVNAGQIKDIPLNSAMQALEGRLAGVNISTTEGGPGANVTIKVRGGGSIFPSTPGTTSPCIRPTRCVKGKDQ